jgi:predicted double-glycine peptidase
MNLKNHGVARYCGVCLLYFHTLVAHAAQFSTLSANGEIAVKSWKSLRDANIVKQNFDYSCGAASLATVLNKFYGLQLTERQILSDMRKPDLMANFEDMARVSDFYGFNAGGIALNYEQLTKLTVPVVVYLRHHREDHFSVLRGISNTHVQLADPSWGNRIFSKQQFLKMWETRNDEKLKGKILLVLPKPPQAVIQHKDFFRPPTPNALGVESLVTTRNTF